MSLSEHDHRRLLDLLTELSFEERQVTLVSGKTSNFYVDCKQTALTAEGHVLVGRRLLGALSAWEVKSGKALGGAGGLTLGADPLASALSLTSGLAGRPLPAFIVRKEAKGHGTGAWIEGTSNLEPGCAVAVLEDVITTGGSAIKAIERMREAGFEVPVVFALVDRQEGGKEAIEALGVDVIALYSRSDFMSD